MRLLPGVGVEYGIDWVIRDLIQQNVESVDTNEAFEASLDGCYPETVKIGWLEVDTVHAIKELDPVSFDIAKSEWIDFESEDGSLVTFDNGSNYHWSHDVEKYLDEEEATLEETG